MYVPETLNGAKPIISTLGSLKYPVALVPRTSDKAAGSGVWRTRTYVRARVSWIARPIKAVAQASIALYHTVTATGYSIPLSGTRPGHTIW
jgi:hypothetical protein